MPFLVEKTTIANNENISLSKKYRSSALTHRIIVSKMDIFNDKTVIFMFVFVYEFNPGMSKGFDIGL